MGIGRREFLSFLSATSVSLFVDAGKAVEIHDHLYVNRKLGLAFRCPNAWHFANVTQMGDVLAGQIHADSEMKQMILDEPLPILTLSKEMLGTSCSFTPGITVHLDVADETQLNLDEIAFLDSGQLNSAFTDFEMLRNPTALVVSKNSAIEYTGKFLFEHEQMQPAMVQMRSLVINHHPAYYTIRMFDSPYIENATFDFDSFVQSFKLV